jgi:uncharacterized cupin superfamily protein
MIQSMRRVNLFSPQLDHAREREGYRGQRARLGKQLDAERIGASLYELAEGQRSFPFHIHHAMEEWLLVVAGSPVVRLADGERELRAGDVMCFPAGPEGAHQVRGPGTVVILSANRALEAVEYPDSGKLGLMPLRKIFRAADAVDYWEGE